jgi:hypothetical protein
MFDITPGVNIKYKCAKSSQFTMETVFYTSCSNFVKMLYLGKSIGKRVLP